MDLADRLTRRRLLLTLPLFPAAVLQACRRRQDQPPAPSCAVPPRRTSGSGALEPAQFEALQAACARLIPTDADPGAAEAGVADYIDAQLGLPQFSVFRQMFQAGLRQLDVLARRAGKARFVDCSARQQDQVLQMVERGVPLGRKGNSGRFFRVLHSFALEGFLGDPVYGGNRDQAGWRFIGFTMRPPRPACPYLGRG